MNREAAMALAQDALIWLAGHENLMPVFLNASGSDAPSVRAGARDPHFLGSVLDFVLMDDAWVVAFCDERDHAYEAPARARAALPGGQQVHWT